MMPTTPMSCYYSSFAPSLCSLQSNPSSVSLSLSHSQSTPLHNLLPCRIPTLHQHYLASTTNPFQSHSSSSQQPSWC
ncbi:hypothetical protein LguiA_010315 [Lonicera macranthoides]